MTRNILKQTRKSKAFTETIQRLFRKLGVELQTYNTHLPRIWSDDETFKTILREIQKHSLVGDERCFMLYQWAGRAGRLDGDMAEVGVYKGGTARLLARTTPHKHLFLFDTFTGMPETHPEFDHHLKGDFGATSLEAVKQFLTDLNNITFCPGVFPESARRISSRKFSFVYIDVDIYQSVKDAINFFYPRMVKGGVLLFDDYKSPSCYGVRKALDEFLADRTGGAITTTRSQCLLIKD